MELKALSSSQERRLITYLDDQLLNLNRHFETRNSPRAVLPTIESYLEFVRPACLPHQSVGERARPSTDPLSPQLSSLQSFILTIPPVGTPTALQPGNRES